MITVQWPEEIRLRSELEAIKTALGCAGMSLADTLKVIDVMQKAAIQETMKGEKL